MYFYIKQNVLLLVIINRLINNIQPNWITSSKKSHKLLSSCIDWICRDVWEKNSVQSRRIREGGTFCSLEDKILISRNKSCGSTGLHSSDQIISRFRNDESKISFPPFYVFRLLSIQISYSNHLKKLSQLVSSSFYNEILIYWRFLYLKLLFFVEVLPKIGI